MEGCLVRSRQAPPPPLLRLQVQRQQHVHPACLPRLPLPLPQVLADKLDAPAILQASV